MPSEGTHWVPLVRPVVAAAALLGGLRLLAAETGHLSHRRLRHSCTGRHARARHCCGACALTGVCT